MVEATAAIGKHVFVAEYAGEADFTNFHLFDDADDIMELVKAPTAATRFGFKLFPRILHLINFSTNSHVHWVLT